MLKAYFRKSLCVMAVLAAGATSSVAQTELERHRQAAIDYYVGTFVRFLGIVGETEYPVQSLKQAAANYYVQAQGNTDDVISAKDAVDAARVMTAAYDVARTADLHRYDLDRDAIVTQEELEISFTRWAWLAARGWHIAEESYTDARTRFDLKLGEMTSDIRRRAGAEAEGDVALSGTVERTYTYQDELGDPDLAGPPYFALFDHDGDSEVGIEEFFGPVSEAIEEADTEGDGTLTEAELADVAQRFEAAQAVLEPLRKDYVLRLK